MKLASLFLAAILAIPASLFGTTIHIPSDQLTIQAGIDAAVNGDTVLVADGTYTGDGNRDIDFLGKGIVVTSERGYNFTWIDVEGQHRGFIFQSGEDSSSVLEGFTITGVNSSTICPGDPCTDRALLFSGVLCASSSPTVVNCQFADNSSAQGAGMTLLTASPVIDGCRFIRNSSENAGAIFLYRADNCLIRDCLFFENSATTGDSTGGGGAIMTYWCAGVTLEGCQFTDNSTNGASGSLRLFGSKVDVTNCTFEGSSSQVGAVACIIPLNGPIYSAAEGTWTNCTMYDNNAPTARAVIHVHTGSKSINLENCVIADGSGGAVLVDSIPGGITLACCNLYGNSGGDWTSSINDQLGINGNISEPPLFMNPDSSDFRLQYCSPCNPFNNECVTLIGAYDIAEEETDPPYFSCHTDTLEVYLSPDSSGECHVPLADYNVAEDCQPITFLPESAWWGEYGGIYWTADTGGLYQFTVMATKPPYGGDTCDVFVFVKGPNIDCPEYTFTPHPDSSGLVNIPLTIHNAYPEHVAVTPDIAHWLELANVGYIQFYADTAGTYVFEVIAETRFGADTCEVVATIGGPVIDCPSDTVCAQPDLTGKICIDLAVASGSLGEISSGEATWLNDELCFYPDDSGGVYSIPLVVSDAFGRDSCEAVVSVMPDIEGNLTPIELIACPGDEVCFPFASEYVNADRILVLSPNSSWTEDSICILPNDTGLISLQVLAGADDCYDTATINLHIHCPDTVTVAPGGTIQAAVDAASNGDIVLIEDGVYSGEGNTDVDFRGKRITLKSKNGPAHCVVNCATDTLTFDPSNRGIWFHYGEDYRTIVDGVRFDLCYGYAIRCDSSSPTIQNCVFHHNGYGIYFRLGSQSRVVNCTFHQNIPFDARGAATYISKSSPIFENCAFVDNYAQGGAAAIEYAPAEPKFYDCLFVENGQREMLGYMNGGAIFLNSREGEPVQATFSDCTFFNNSGTGSVLWVNGNYPSHADFTNCIIAFNEDDLEGYYAGGAINCNDVPGCNINLSCCNVFGNLAGDYIYCIAGENGTKGNFSADPRFRDTTVNDIHPLDLSPCLAENNSCGVRIGTLEEGAYEALIGTDMSATIDNLTITFDSVTLTGDVNITSDSIGPELGSYITTVPNIPRTYYYIETDALYEDSITICISYDDADVVTDESAMSMLHYYNNVWDDITISHDTVTNLLCGRTNSLSPFCLTQLTDPLDVNDDNRLAHTFELSQNYPNPFNPSTTISFSLAAPGQVKLEIVNILGQTVVTLIDDDMTVGNHEIVWNGVDSRGTPLASGVYLYRLKAGDQKQTCKMLLLK